MTAYYYQQQQQQQHHFPSDAQEGFAQHALALGAPPGCYYEYDYDAGYQPVALQLVPPELVVPSHGEPERGASKVLVNDQCQPPAALFKHDSYFRHDDRWSASTSSASETDAPSFVYQSRAQPQPHQHQRSQIHAVPRAPAGLWTMAPLAVEDAHNIGAQRDYEPEAYRQREEADAEDRGRLKPLAHALTEYADNPSPASVPRSAAAFKFESQVLPPTTHCALPQPLLAPVPVHAQISAAHQPVPLERRSTYSELALNLDFMARLEHEERASASSSSSVATSASSTSSTPGTTTQPMAVFEPPPPPPPRTQKRKRPAKARRPRSPTSEHYMPSRRPVAPLPSSHMVPSIPLAPAIVPSVPSMSSSASASAQTGFLEHPNGLTHSSAVTYGVGVGARVGAGDAEDEAQLQPDPWIPPHLTFAPSTSIPTSSAPVPSPSQDSDSASSLTFDMELSSTTDTSTTSTSTSNTTATTGGGSKKGRIIRNKKEPRKPSLACTFCKERKIACGRPAEGSADMTCNQCQRRSFTCVYTDPGAKQKQKQKQRLRASASASASVSVSTPRAAGGVAKRQRQRVPAPKPKPARKSAAVLQVLG